MELTLAGDVRYSVDEAKHVIAGYSLTLDPLPWENPDREHRSFGDEPSDLRAPRWAYGNYDNIPPSRSGALGSTDLYVIAGLNAEIRSAELGAIRAIADQASAALGRIPEDVCFWNLHRDEVLDPSRDSHSWWLHRAWWLMEGVHGVGPARSHKVLHHKRPRIVPLLDRQTVGRLQEAAKPRARGNSWVQILDDLVEHEVQFTELEEWFAARPGRRLPLFRLRLHDILLWCDVTGNRENAARAGESVLTILDGSVEGHVVGFPIQDEGSSA